MAGEPVIYYMPGCPFALRLRTTLRVHRVPFRSVRFRDNEAGAQQVPSVNNGNGVSPTALVNGRWLTNPTWRDVDRARST